jgi:microcystin-dependent protein
MDFFLAEIRIFPLNFAPQGWASCNGQILPISQNTALFSLLGTAYGGNGVTTFALPNMQGNAPMHPNPMVDNPPPPHPAAAGLSAHILGETGGSEAVRLLQTEVPAHAHPLRAATQDAADVSIPSSASTYAPSTGGTLYQASADGTLLANEPLGLVGGNLPHNNMMPYLTLNFCIALQGIFPPRG